MGPTPSRGISIAELEEVAAAVQSHLRDAGYFLAVAFVPSQTVVDGQVWVDVLPGVVGDVVVSGASDRLVRRFDDLLGRPLKEREVNTRLYALNQAPGFTARASFQPGEAVGETDLHLEVLEASALRGRVAVDNHGDDQTGKERIRLSGDLINPETHSHEWWHAADGHTGHGRPDRNTFRQRWWRLG